MCDKTMENYKPNMFQLQCLKALEIQIEEGKGYNEADDRCFLIVECHLLKRPAEQTWNFKTFS